MRKFISCTVDVLAGVAALFLFLVCDNFLHVAAALPEAVVVLALFCLVAGFLRGASGAENSWLKGLLIAAGLMAPLLTLEWNGMIHAVLAIYLLTAGLFAICGAEARSLRARQSSMKGAMIVLVPAVAVVILALTIIPTVAARIATRRMTAGAPVPTFTVTTGRTSIDSSTLRGRVIVLSFWATWCPACRRELPELDRLYRQYRNDPDVRFFAVDIPGSGETAEKAEAYMRSGGYALPVALIRENLSEDSGDGLPSLIILDKLGRRRLLHTGYDQSEHLQLQLSGEIDTLLRENRSTYK